MSSKGIRADEDQRTRALEALAEVIAAHGLAGVPSASGALQQRTGLSRLALRRLLGEDEAAVLATFELGVERATAAVAGPFAAAPSWLAGVRAAMAGFLAFLEAEPALGRLLVLSSAGGGERMLARREEVLRAVSEAVDSGHRAGRRVSTPPGAHVGEGVVGAVFAVLGNRLLSESSPDLTELYGSLVSIVVLPYLGAAAARRELTRLPPGTPRSRARPHVAARAAVVARAPTGRRLTYRSARVLGALAERPGASNREVAERAGIVDQGQVSKLLGRLREQGLLESRQDRPGRGAPKAWTLTAAGRRAVRSAGSGEAAGADSGGG